MIVCSCNVIREADLRAAAARGCGDAEAVYAAMGCEFECGGCRDHADEIVSEARTNPAEIAQQAA